MTPPNDPDLRAPEEEKITTRFRPWLSSEDARTIEALPTAEARRAYEAFLHAEARSDIAYREHTQGAVEEAWDARSATEANFQYGAGGGRRIARRKPAE